MPTPLDRLTQSRGAFFAFAGIVTAATAWVVWGGDVFPAEPDPTGDPATWTNTELRRWLRNRNLLPSELATREELLERVHANMRPPPRA
ncbi:hypothetical protein DIS24_g10744 [Lasiodiplodia hormozganensis]|uniref:STE24 endopeptidase n=2 Tax=Lasiodiplodia TaxID=66739 RepID=A0A5N5D3K6_9PEZI|nr:hypothetical protein DBV05_g9115 [Lasiodiplodia theobromae]KAK0637515.1 hypothetical protein DIS24_g10744 [Lasiodiplodia hormozganensis]